jgi:hypothetical protein
MECESHDNGSKRTVHYDIRMTWASDHHYTYITAELANYRTSKPKTA